MQVYFLVMEVGSLGLEDIDIKCALQVDFPSTEIDTGSILGLDVRVTICVLQVDCLIRTE